MRYERSIQSWRESEWIVSGLSSWRTCDWLVVDDGGLPG